MGLTIKEITACRNVSIRCDRYVPFVVEIERFGRPDNPIYWRTGDGSRSLIEIGIDRRSGVICSVTLTLIDSGSVGKIDDKPATNLPEIEGLPVFEVSGWKTPSDTYADDFRDEFDSEVFLSVGRNFVALDFQSTGRPVRYTKNQQLRFGFSHENHLSSLEITELNSLQIQSLEECVEGLCE